MIRYAQRYGTRRPWLVQLLSRRTPKIGAVALANKMARMIWAMMITGERYREPTVFTIRNQVGSAPGGVWEGSCDLMHSSVETESGKTHLRHSASSACFWSDAFRGRHYGQRPMHAASIGRTHGRTDRKAEHRKSPCQRRAVHTWAQSGGSARRASRVSARMPSSDPDGPQVRRSCD